MYAIYDTKLYYKSIKALLDKPKKMKLTDCGSSLEEVHDDGHLVGVQVGPHFPGLVGEVPDGGAGKKFKKLDIIVGLLLKGHVNQSV